MLSLPKPTKYLPLSKLLPITPHRTARRSAKEAASQDPRRTLLIHALYPQNAPTRNGRPVGSYRPDVLPALQKVLINRTVHETIERAWKLHQRHIRKEREEDGARKFGLMRDAMRELESVDVHLAREADRKVDPTVYGEDEWGGGGVGGNKEKGKEIMAGRGREKMRRVLDSRIPGFFPREMRVPTETGPRGGWDHEWKAVSEN